MEPTGPHNVITRNNLEWVYIREDRWRNERYGLYAIREDSVDDSDDHFSTDVWHIAPPSTSRIYGWPYLYAPTLEDAIMVLEAFVVLPKSWRIKFKFGRAYGMNSRRKIAIENYIKDRVSQNLFHI